VLGLSLVERIVHDIEPAFLAAGYFIIAGGVLLERSIFLGLIVPGDLILALGGVYASQRKMDLIGVIVVGTLAAITGESVGFWLGRRFGVRLLRHLPFFGKGLSRVVEESEDYFRKHGGKTVAIGRYATAAGAFIPFTAGAGRMSYARFLAFDVPAIVIWAAGITVFGYYFGRNLSFVDKVLSRFGYGVLALAVLIVAGRFLWKRHQERKKPRSSDRSPS
jgi:membrane-associated protein